LKIYVGAPPYNGAYAGIGFAAASVWLDFYPQFSVLLDMLNI
jgi:hypothetical protein